MRHKLSIPVLLLAWSCSTGPWNTQPGGGVPVLPRLVVSNLVVAGRPFDTLWLTRSLLLNGATYDSTRSFVDTTRSWVRIIRTGPGAPDTVPYHLAPPLAVVWLPARPLDTVIHGATYRLEARITWDSTPNWGSGPTTTPAWKVTQLVATTYTPAVFSQGPMLLAPVEALFPTLAASGNAAFQTWAKDTSAAVRDSLARRQITPAALDSVARGIAVFRPIRSGDTVWYIRSSETVSSEDGTAIQRSDRPYLAPQTLDLKVFGGELSIQRFDSTRARILDPITQALHASAGRGSFTSKDSAGYYQPGQWRMIGFLDANVGNLAYWPQDAQIKNLDIGYTGANVFYTFAMDTLYAAYARGQSATTNVPAYTDIQGGYGYFSGAAVDSLSLYVQSPTADTFAVSALQNTFCFRKFGNLVDSLLKANVTDTSTIGSDWIAQRPRQCQDFVPPR